jgi:hypothetical protein
MPSNGCVIGLLLPLHHLFPLWAAVTSTNWVNELLVLVTKLPVGL